ncbi:hypothetical protein D3C80_1916650 [compost metagenome]
MLAFFGNDLFCGADKRDVANLQASLFCGFAARCLECWFQVIDFSARNAPVAGFWCFHATAKQNLAVTLNHQSAANTGKINAW